MKSFNKILLFLILLFSVPPPSYTQNSRTQLKKVFSFESLDKIEKYEDLPKYGLVAPNHKNHVSGKNLIMLALKATSFLKGDWVLAHGLLGVTMLDFEVIDFIAYRSLFMGGIKRSKMHSSYSGDNALLVFRQKTTPNSKSIITKREAAIYLLSNELHSRYVYNDKGNFERNYDPQPGRKSNEKLKDAFKGGITVLQELSEMKYKDDTLRDVLGMAYASLNHDSLFLSFNETLSLGPLQVYSDALSATLKKFKETPEHNYDVLNELGWEMQSRGLVTNDRILLPVKNDNFQAILRIIEKDIDVIKK